MITITRDIVQLEETFVKSSIVEKDGKKYGIIDLPKFYINFEDRNFYGVVENNEVHELQDNFLLSQIKTGKKF